MYAYQEKLNTGETREETRTTERKRKIVNLAYSGRTSDFNIVIGGLDFNILRCRLETKNFILQV